jgi:hypothetical protein
MKTIEEVDRLRESAARVAQAKNRALEASDEYDLAVQRDALVLVESAIEQALAERLAAPVCPFCGGPMHGSGNLAGFLICADCQSQALHVRGAACVHVPAPLPVNKTAVCDKCGFEVEWTVEAIQAHFEQSPECRKARASVDFNEEHGAGYCARCSRDANHPVYHA